MKIDISTIVLIILLVAPGLLARRSRHALVPKSFEDQGPAAELGDLVTLGLFPHVGLLSFTFVCLLLSGLLRHGDALYLIRLLDSGSPLRWCEGHPVEASGIFLFYVIAILIVGYFSGFVFGWLNLSHPIREWIFSNEPVQRLLRKLRVFSVLDESPISYEIFSRPSLLRGEEQLVFLEIEFRNGGGFVTGEVEKYAIVEDAEPHKPVILREPWYRADRSADYARIEGDRLLVDLSDALTVVISYQDRRDVELLADGEELA